MSGVSPHDFSYEARDVILNMTVIESLGFGVYSAVFWFTLYLLLLDDRKPKHTPLRLKSLIIIIPLYILAIVHLMTRWVVTRLSFIVHGQTADTILDGFLLQPTWCHVLSVVSFSLNTLIADFVTVWRCWMIWNRDWRVSALPILLVLSGTAFCIISAIFQIEPNVLSSSNFNRFAQFSLIYFIFSLASMTISTALMVYRIISVGPSTGFHLEKGYRKVVEIIVESAALYCIALVIFLPFLVRDDFSSGYSEAVLNSATAIAPTIIAGRVALGVARDYSMVSRSGKISTLAFARSETADISHSENSDSLNVPPRQRSEGIETSMV
ncbi:hypothetical protein NP233_g11841 [Leucocoprinus birnbaumii]|uniref:Uncharacterized protein n=1 Tax=Leucocoprinus birnbaumii TaxID=56174 RepID=A0AAD5VG09_9AGAR|nr:hypothetical protein NP233_g11841 [Leucocoprinus birnbaumii]